MGKTKRTDDMPPVSCLSYQDRRDAFQAAKENLSNEDRRQVEMAANNLLTALKAKHPGMQFSPEGSLETIAAIGIFLSRRAK